MDNMDSAYTHQSRTPAFVRRRCYRRFFGGERCGRRRLSTLLVAALLNAAVAYKGGYFRFGRLSWKQTEIKSDGIVVQFTLKTAWSRAYFARGPSDEPEGNCVECQVEAKNPARECDNFPAGHKVVQSACILPVPGDRVALYDAVDTGNLDDNVLGGALPPVETSFAFGDDPSSTLTGARIRTARTYKPRCRSDAEQDKTVFGKCIEGIVVDSFDVAGSTPSPEADARDIVYVLTQIEYTYPKKTDDYVAQFQGCCRMGSQNDGDGGFYDLVNNANGAFFLRTHVSVTDDPQVLMTGTASSPFFSHTPHITAIKGRPLVFRLHAFDAANRPIKYEIGNNDDHGVGLNQQASKTTGNAMLATINEDTGVITFPASASTSYENYYNLVVKATAYGPCHGHDSTALQVQVGPCYKAGNILQTAKTTTIIDFLIRVVQAGFTGDWPQNRCDNPNSGLPAGSKICNTIPVVTVPTSTQRFICDEENAFVVTATDGPGNDKTVSNPSGAFAIRMRQRLELEYAWPPPASNPGASTSGAYPLGSCNNGGITGDSVVYVCIDDKECILKQKGQCPLANARNSPRFPYGILESLTSGEDEFGQGNRDLDRANPGYNYTGVATASFKWRPKCERLESDTMYSYLGRHRLDVYGACFVAVDEGGLTEKAGKLTSMPGCVDIAVLRCTKPTIDLIGMSKPAANDTLSTWQVPVSTNLSLTFNGTDDTQSQRVTIFHTEALGIPAEGASWGAPQCHQNDDLSITCNPVQRDFKFEARLIHAGFMITVCFEAFNDQVECPRYRTNTGAKVSVGQYQRDSLIVQSYGVHESVDQYNRPIKVSQASEPLCVKLDVPGPQLVWADPTPAEGHVVLTYSGCPLVITLVTEDLNNYFDVEILPDTAEFAVPDGLIVGAPKCYFRQGVDKPTLVAEGIGSCPAVSRTMTWTPARSQSGLKKTVCVDSATKTRVKAKRCFMFHVSKCRYCAQQGQTLQAVAESYYTDWLQIWAANTHLPNPNDFKLHQLINLGSLYPARAGDTIASLAHRFRADPRSLLLANPEIQSESSELIVGASYCILAGVCAAAEYSESRS